MTFTKESGMAQIYYRLVEGGARTLEQVPTVGGLRDVVAEMLAEGTQDFEKEQAK